MTRCPRCGSEERRSNPQLRRYFALVKAAYHHIPDKHILKPASEEHLRKWLQCKAGHFTEHRVKIKEGMSPNQIAAIIRGVMSAAESYSIVQAYKTHVRIIIPKSIDYKRLSHKDACALFKEVEDVVWVEFGIDPDKLLKEAEAA